MILKDFSKMKVTSVVLVNGADKDSGMVKLAEAIATSHQVPVSIKKD